MIWTMSVRKRPSDRMNVGDMVSWSTSKNHDYFNIDFKKRGILIQKLENYDYWIYATVLDEQGKVDKVMLYKEDNPL